MATTADSHLLTFRVATSVRGVESERRAWWVRPWRQGYLPPPRLTAFHLSGRLDAPLGGNSWLRRPSAAASVDRVHAHARPGGAATVTSSERLSDGGAFNERESRFEAMKVRCVCASRSCGRARAALPRPSMTARASCVPPNPKTPYI